MATPRLYSQYPKEYTSLFEAALRAPVVLECNSPKEARKYRGQLYAFRISLGAKDCTAPPSIVVGGPLLGFKIDGCNLIIHRPERKGGILSVLEQVKANSQTVTVNAKTLDSKEVKDEQNPGSPQ